MGTKRYWRKLRHFFDRLFKRKGYAPSGGGSGGSAPRAEIVWCYGGEDGGKAIEDTSSSGYKLESVRFDGATVKFSGSGAMWGNTHDKPEARNCLFFKEGGKYYGGFWEWGDPTRTSRAIDNINCHYKGWDPARLAKATEFAFCVMDKASRHRSNFVEFKKS